VPDTSLTPNLILFLGFALSAVIMAAAGRIGGTRAAFVATLALWCGYTFFLRFELRTGNYYWIPAWRFWLLGVALALVQLMLVLLPTLLLRRFGWIRLGLAGGVAGAALAAWSFRLMLLLLGCLFGIDCL
jgi:hypothetical protein